MFLFDVVDDSQMRMQIQEGAIVLTGLHHEMLPRTYPRTPTQHIHPGTDDEVRRQSRFLQNSLQAYLNVILDSLPLISEHYSTPQKLDSSLRWIFWTICDRNIA